MKKLFNLLFFLVFFQLTSFGQNEQLITGKSEIEKIKNGDENEFKFNKMGSQVEMGNYILVDPNRNSILDFGEDAQIKCFIQNSSMDIFEDLELRISSNWSHDDIIFPSVINIKKLKPNGIFEVVIPIKNNSSDLEMKEIMEFSFNLIYDEIAIANKSLNLEIGKKNNPNFLITVPSSSFVNKNKRADESAETVNLIKLSMLLKNEGNFSLFKVKGSVKIFDVDGQLLFKNDSYYLEGINQKEEKEIRLNFITGLIKDNKIIMKVEFKGNNNTIYINKKFEIDL
ncbi:MAG: hypothetical protein JEY96_17845 [Bacteroidales bacterium]|nr:hypothetical protein [Bacteroidales bacterium]